MEGGRIRAKFGVASTMFSRSSAYCSLGITLSRMIAWILEIEAGSSHANRKVWKSATPIEVGE